MTRFVRRSALLFVSLFFAVAFLTLPCALTANAQTDQWYSPTCEVVFDSSSPVAVASKATELRYSDGKATLVSTYQLHADAPSSLACTLPVYGRLGDFPSTDVQIAYKGVSVADSVVFDYSSYRSGFFNSESLDDVLAFCADTVPYGPSVMNMTIHEYVVTATAETSFEFSLQPSDRMLYTFRSHSYDSADRHYTVNLANEQVAHLLIFGDPLDLVTTETYSVVAQDLRLDSYLSTMIETYINPMAEGTDYSRLARYRLCEFLAAEYGVAEEFTLWDSCFAYGYAYHYFTLAVDAGDSTLSVSQPMNLGINGSYTPTVFVGKIFAPSSTAPFTFTVSTDEYVLESTLALTDKSYSGDSVESITIALCSVQKPDLIGGGAQQPKYPTWLIVVEVILCVLAVGLLTFLVITIVRYIKSKKSAK